jgi:DNA-binding SARP family transcriptional activator
MARLARRAPRVYNRFMIDFRVLGPVEVWRDGERVDLGGRKQRATLALLLLDRGRAVSQDRLVDALWGESPPRTALTSLQNFVSQLRKLIGPGVVVTRPSGYEIDVEPEQLDLGRFAALVEKARPLTGAERAATLREALSMWRGPPLAEFTFEPFAQPEIARLEELRLAALEERLEAELESGREAELVVELDRLVSANPLRERLRALLMLALYRSGRQAEALQAYLDGRRLLVDEVGIEPGAPLQELQTAILRQDPALQVGRRPANPGHRFDEVVAAMLAGRVIPVLGADAAGLASRLAERFAYPAADATLPLVAQYVATMKGSGPLYDELHALVDAESEPSAVHRFLAGLPPLLRSRGAPHQVIVTTDYDLALERAFLEAGEEFDIVSYVATGPNRGRFSHVRPDGTRIVIELPNQYASELSPERRTIVLRLHGQVDPTPEREGESFVVMEDDYIDYLAQTGVANVVPVGLTAKLRRSHFLFLGYSMSDWNLRLLMHRLRGDQPLSYRSWAVEPHPTPLEREFWSRREVDVVELELEEYVTLLASHLPAPQAAGAHVR